MLAHILPPKAQHLLAHELVDCPSMDAEARHSRQLFKVSSCLRGDENAQPAEIFLFSAHVHHILSPSKRQVVPAERVAFLVLLCASCGWFGEGRRIMLRGAVTAEPRLLSDQLGDIFLFPLLGGVGARFHTALQKNWLSLTKMLADKVRKRAPGDDIEEVGGGRAVLCFVWTVNRDAEARYMDFAFCHRKLRVRHQTAHHHDALVHGDPSFLGHGQSSASRS